MTQKNFWVVCNSPLMCHLCVCVLCWLFLFVCVWVRSHPTFWSVSKSVVEIHHRHGGAWLQRLHQIVLQKGKTVPRWEAFPPTYCTYQHITNLHVCTKKSLLQSQAFFFFNVCFIFVWSVQIDPSQSRSALLYFPYLLPCVCVQVLPAPNHLLDTGFIILLNQSVFHASVCLVYIDRFTTLIEILADVKSAHFKIKVSQVSVTDQSCESYWKWKTSFSIFGTIIL